MVVNIYLLRIYHHKTVKKYKNIMKFTELHDKEPV